MKVDLLIAEIGSTTTLVTAFDGLAEGRPRKAGQGQAETTISENDVTLGLTKAIDDMSAKAGTDLSW